MDRFTLIYRFSTDNGLTWIDLTPQVDSRQTSITHNLCTNNFTSAKDEATFVMPETPLFDANGNATPKKSLIDAILGDDDILVEINAPGAVNVLWDGNLVQWDGYDVWWRGSTRRFTGYVDRSSISLRSYPLPPNLTVKLQDVSILRLDDKVDSMVCWESYTIKQIVRGLLSLAGYDNTDPSLSDADTSVMSSTDNVTLEAFVIDKDSSQTYRHYIDTLLFEAGGYVIDFTEDGTARLVHLQWDGNVTPSRTIDNPMNSGGVTMKGTWLKEDGARVKWSTLEWGEGERIWQAGINQTAEDGVMIGEKVQNMAYWPSNGDQAPVYMEYDARLLDKPYLSRTTRWQNEDLSIIMAKNISIRKDSMQGSSPFDSWVLRDPTTWPTGDTWEDKYGLTSNPQFWPTKMWMLLQNQSGSDVNLTFFSVYGDVLYRSKVNTIETDGSKNPKEYTSEYIYDSAQAQRFLNFYWHFMKTSRYQFSWSEPNRSSNLNDVVSVGVKGNGTYQKALIAGRTSKWINDNVEVITYNAVGVTTYTPAALIATGTLPSSATVQTQPVKDAIAATFSTVPSFTLAEWQVFGTAGQAQSWTITNPSDFTAGDVAIITGKISDMDDTAIHLYMNVSDVTGSVISGTGIRIEYLPVLSNWDFDIGQSTVPRNDRIPWNPNDSDSYTDIHLTSKQTGIGVLEYWTCDGTSSPLLTYFVGANAQTTTGSAPILRIYKQETYPEITVTMRSSDNVYSVTKKITIVNETEYDHDFGAWEPNGGYQLPDHFTVGGIDYDVIPGDFFVAKSTFTAGGDTYSQGVPYEFRNNSWHNPISATAENAKKLLSCMGNVLSDPSIQPSTAALYGWFQNLVAKNAVINSLAAELATINNLVITGNIFNDVLTTNNSVTTTTTYTFISSHQTIGSVTREWLKISDIESAMGSSSISVLCTGTVVIAGTSYTGTLANPISVKYVKNTSLTISQGSRLCWFSYSTITNEYLAEVSDKALSSNALTVTANLGSISVHSVLPQNSNYDNLASNEIPFNKGWIKELFVKNVHGLNYNYAGTITRADYITDNNSHSMTFTYDGEAFVNVSASLTSSGLAVNSGLLTLKTGSYAHAPSGCVCLPLYSGGSIYSSFIILEFSINPVNGTITYRSQGASSSREIYVEFQFFK